MKRAPCLALLAATACLEAPPGALPDAALVVGTPDAAPDEIDAAVAPTNPRTCATILAASPDEANGRQTIDPDGDGGAEPFEAYCDMTIAGGGWMLVARSIGIANNVPFGWLYDSGAVNVLDEPYCLSVNRPGLTFTEILIGSRDEQRTWGDNVFLVSVPEGFVEDHMATAVDTEPETVKGACSPGGGPAMLNHVGHTDAVGHYFMRDMTVDQNFGFYPSGFALSGDACSTSGGLHGEHGMIFVR